MADSSAPVPEALTVHAQSRVLEVVFAGGEAYRIPFELLRVYSPSAEVQGHGPGQEVLQTGKRDVTLVGLEPVATTPSSPCSPTATTAASSPGPICTNSGATRRSSGSATCSACRTRAPTATRRWPPGRTRAGAAAATERDFFLHLATMPHEGAGLSLYAGPVRP